MPKITTEHGLKKCWDVPFCYLCGKAFGRDEARNRDHVPPTTVFAKNDRIHPLILPTHRTCNETVSKYDEQIGQLVGVIHKSPKRHKTHKLEFLVHAPGEGAPSLLLTNLNLSPIVFRWVRGFHTALYRRYLPDCGGYVHPPMPEWRSDKGVRNIYPVQFKYVEIIKKNRISGTLDTVICRNGKCRYECVWCEADNGKPMCVFALDVYGWCTLGDQRCPARSCVGIYFAPDGPPLEASRDTNLVFPFRNKDTLNAFGE